MERLQYELKTIREMGFAVETFSCAEDFLRSDVLGKTSCLITDMRMPGMSGLEMHMRLLAMGTPVPFASSKTVSLVLVCPSTLTQLNVRFAIRRARTAKSV